MLFVMQLPKNISGNLKLIVVMQQILHMDWEIFLKGNKLTLTKPKLLKEIAQMA